MEDLVKVLREGEDWLIARILGYAKERGYTRYTSTLLEAWRLSITGLTDSLVRGLRDPATVVDFDPDEPFTSDPVAAFGVREAQLHRQRGVSLPMFLGLYKYYRQVYLDLVAEQGDRLTDPEGAEHYVLRAFDRIEIAFCTEWAQHTQEDLLDELRDANRRMTNEKNAYLTAFESLSEPVVLLDPDDRVLNLNHAAALLVDPDNTPGGTYYGDRDPGGAPLDEVLPWLAAGLEDSRLSVELGDMVRHFDLRVSPLLDVSDKYVGRLVLLHDVTKITALEEERRHYQRRELESLRKRSLVLMAGGVAHDFNNLLTGISGYTSLALEEVGAGTVAREYLEQIEIGAARATRLSAQMLAYSGRTILDRRQVDLAGLVGSMHPLLRTAVPEQVVVMVHLDPEPPQVLADPPLMRQVTLELVSNAAEALGAKGGVVRLGVGTREVGPELLASATVEGELSPGWYAALRVTDDGEGIEPANLDRVFDPFFSTRAVGRGLGLASVLGITHSHGGAVRLHSELGVGTTVEVLLPLAPTR